MWMALKIMKESMQIMKNNGEWKIINGVMKMMKINNSIWKCVAKMVMKMNNIGNENNGMAGEIMA